MLGAVPRGFHAIVEFDDITQCPEIAHTAWGYVDYVKPLSADDVKAYELAYAGIVNDA